MHQRLQILQSTHMSEKSPFQYRMIFKNLGSDEVTANLEHSKNVEFFYQHEHVV